MEKVREALEDLKPGKRKWWSSRVCFRNRNQQKQKIKSRLRSRQLPKRRWQRGLMRANYLFLLVVPTGLEPVLPT